MSVVTTTAARPGVLRWRPTLVLGLVSLVGVVAFFWPFLADPGSAIIGHAADAPWLFALLLPLLLALVLTELANGGLDSRGIALLGVLSAVAAVLRPFGAGTVGFEPIWVVIILGGRALGPGFGFLLGNISLFASAMLTGGVGPWLPFQMIAAGWIGFGAGVLPRVAPRWEPALLAAYGAVVGLCYGFLLNLWFWPWLAPANSAIAFEAGAGIAENLSRWLLFNLATSLGYDLPRAVVVAVLLLVASRPVLAALRRATRKAAFDQPVVFTAAT
jgi:energy-coupling factor transport system substrate-specific component